MSTSPDSGSDLSSASGSSASEDWVEDVRVAPGIASHFRLIPAQMRQAEVPVPETRAEQRLMLAGLERATDQVLGYMAGFQGVSTRGVTFSQVWVPALEYGAHKEQPHAGVPYSHPPDSSAKTPVPSASSSSPSSCGGPAHACCSGGDAGSGGEEDEDARVLVDVYQPQGEGPHSAVVWLHGGAMAFLSPNTKTYRVMGYLLAGAGIKVFLPHFTNSRVAPFPRGLHDCVSTVQWVLEHQAPLGISSQVVVCGESGGGNLCLATALLAHRVGLEGIRGVYSMCPLIRGVYPADDCPSHREFHSWVIKMNGPFGKMLVDLYSVEGEEDQPLSPSQYTSLMWPSVASEEELKTLPPTVISVNELDPLRDEGLTFARRAAKAGANVRYLIRGGLTHAADLYYGLVPTHTKATVADIAAFVSSL